MNEGADSYDDDNNNNNNNDDNNNYNNDDDSDFTWKNIKDTEITYRTKAPKTVNQYLLGEALGKGSYAKVREALDTHSMLRVAIKIVKKQQMMRKLPGGGEEASIKNEIAIMRGLDHPNVVKLFESFSNDQKGKLYIVLEYVGGGTLQDLLDRAPNSRLPLKQARRYLRHLVQGLQYIHSQGIVHRDIKPGNMMLTIEGVLKVSDFGVAERLTCYDEPAYTSKTQGSPAFQPPEIASGTERFSGIKGDVWAAGISLYYIVTGVYPFAGNTVYTLFENIARAEYVIPANLKKKHPTLANLISSMLEPDRNKRLSTQDILQHPWLQEGDEDSDNDREGDGEEFVELIPSRTLFTPEFVSEMTKMRESGSGIQGDSSDQGDTPRGGRDRGDGDRERDREKGDRGERGEGDRKDGDRERGRRRGKKGDGSDDGLKNCFCILV